MSVKKSFKIFSGMNNSIFDKLCFFELEFSRFVISCHVLVAKILKDLVCNAFSTAELSLLGEHK